MVSHHVFRSTWSLSYFQTDPYGGSHKRGIPQNGWLTEKIPSKWMTLGRLWGPPIFGHLHIFRRRHSKRQAAILPQYSCHWDLFEPCSWTRGLAEIYSALVVLESLIRFPHGLSVAHLHVLTVLGLKGEPDLSSQIWEVSFRFSLLCWIMLNLSSTRTLW